MSGTSGIPGAAGVSPMFTPPAFGPGAPRRPEYPLPPPAVTDVTFEDGALRKEKDGHVTTLFTAASEPAPNNGAPITSEAVFQALALLLSAVYPEWAPNKDPNYAKGSIVAYNGRVYCCTASSGAVSHTPPVSATDEWSEAPDTVYDKLVALTETVKDKLDNYGACKISESGRLTIEGNSTYFSPDRLVLTDKDTGDTLRMFGRATSASPGVAYITFTSYGTTRTYWLPAGSGVFALALQALPLETLAPKFRIDKAYSKGDMVTVDDWSPHGHGAVVSMLRFTQDYPAGPLTPGYEAGEKDYEVVDVATLVSEYVPKATSFTPGNLAMFDAEGNLVDSGHHF